MQDDVAQEVTPIAEHLPAPQLRRVLLIETNRGENEDLAHLHIFPLLAEAGKGNTPNLKKMLELQNALHKQIYSGTSQMVGAVCHHASVALPAPPMGQVPFSAGQAGGAEPHSLANHSHEGHANSKSSATISKQPP